MRTASAALETFLQSRIPCYRADLYTFTLRDGTPYYWSDYDQNLLVGTTTFLANGPLLTRTRLEVKNTVEVPSLDVTMCARDNDVVENLNIKTQLHNGLFDGCNITLQRIFMPSKTDTSLGTILMFGGRMSGIQLTAVGAKLSFKGANILFNQNVPRNVYHTSCMHNFCDAGCTLLASSFTLTGQTVAAGSTNQLINWSTPPANQAIYRLGKITFTSGNNSGSSRQCKVVTGGVITVSYPFYAKPQAGDTFSILQGCTKAFNDGSGQDCTARSNTQHYRGFDFVPSAYQAF